MSKTATKMRSLANAVPGPNGGVRFQPIFPETLRSWAGEIERMNDALVRIQDLTQHDMGMSPQEEACVWREATAALKEQD